MNEWIPQNVSAVQLIVLGVTLYAGFTIFRKVAALAKVAAVHVGPGLLCSLGMIGGAGAIGMGAASTPAAKEVAISEGRLPFSDDELLTMAKNAKSTEELQKQIDEAKPKAAITLVSKTKELPVIDHPKVKSISLFGGIAAVIVAFGAFLNYKGAFN